MPSHHKKSGKWKQDLQKRINIAYIIYNNLVAYIENPKYKVLELVWFQNETNYIKIDYISIH